jgi:hypothetical protein
MKLARIVIPSSAGFLLGLSLHTALWAAEFDIRYLSSDDSLLQMRPYSFAGGKTLDLAVGIGSSAFHSPGDLTNVLWTLGDRGPNFACDEMKSITGVEFAACGQVRSGRVHPVPHYAPSIYRLLLGERSFRITDVITLKDSEGYPLTGLANPLRTATTEAPLDGQGERLALDVHGIDPEALVRLSDGSFWIGEENAPSLMHFGPNGKMIARHVPAGTEADFAGARHQVFGSLPAILARRQSNRGIEAIATSPDEQFLYFIMQSPLANPDTAVFRQARNTRLFKLDRRSMQVVGEYVYRLDDPGSFRRDPSQKQSDVRISELTALAADRLIVLERTDQTTKLYRVDLAGATNIARSPWDEAETRPTLEQIDLGAAGITPLTKNLCFDTADDSNIVGKTEGMALLPDGTLVLINDSDFGIAGAGTQIVLLRKTGGAPC